MLNPRHAALAYQANAGYRNLRAQEAEVFRQANAGLNRARDGSSTMQIRALADNERLWTMVVGLVRDPANLLPTPLRASLASVGLAVLRDMKNPSPDYEFLIAINEDVAAGLSAPASGAAADGARAARQGGIGGAAV